jgi:predicted metalloprotease
MRWQGRRESDNVEDRRNDSGSPLGGGGGFRLPSGKGGIVLLIIVLVAGYYGVDLTGMLTGPFHSSKPPPNAPSARRKMKAAKFTKVILADTEDTWGAIFKRWAVSTRSRSWCSIAARRGPAAVPASR